MLAGARLVDLTQPLGTETILWPGSSPVEITELGSHEADGAYWRDLALPEHSGTHLDAPAHFGPGRETVDELPLERLVVPAVRLDVRALVGGNPGFTLSTEQVEELERAESRIPAGHAVLVCTGWDAYVSDPGRYGAASSPPAFPGIGPDTAQLLVERGVVGIGIDTLGIDPGYADGFPAHRITQPAGLWHLEGLVNVHLVPPRGAWLAAAPVRLVGGSGMPVRAFAIVP